MVPYIGFLGNQLPATQAQFDANEQYSFVIGSDRTIQGYSQGVDGMRIGGTRVIIVPPELGYGDAGAAGVIPPKSVLTFLITLKSAELKRRQEAAPAQPQVEQAAAPAAPPKPDRPLTTLERLQKTGAVAAMPERAADLAMRVEPPRWSRYQP